MISDVLKNISADVKDIANTAFDYKLTYEVPNDSDAGLSYEGGVTKWGKEITTCVLYVDIRNSVGLTTKHQSKTMGKLYTAFVKGVVKAARDFNGHTRNIIGDRVMIVFPVKNCFTNAVGCGLAINNVAGMIATQFPSVVFKCGIGIDHGAMRVIKVGVARRGQESKPNKGLVWAGKPANLASRLTDMGNKTVTKIFYDIERSPFNPKGSKPARYDVMGPLQKIISGYDPSAPFYLPNDKITLSETEFLSTLHMSHGVALTRGGRIQSATKRTVTHKYETILITERVYNGLAQEGASHLNKVGWWKVDDNAIRDLDCPVRSGNYFWSV
jgi:adenylate cyclase